MFFALPLVNQVNVSLQSGDPETGYAFDWAFSTYTEAIKDYHVPLHPLDRLRRDGDRAVPDHRLPAAYFTAFKAGRYKNLILLLIILPFFTSVAPCGRCRGS